MFKCFAEILLVMLLGILPVNLATTPKAEKPYVTTAVTYSAEAQKPDGVRNARLENMLNRNYCFGSDFESANAVVTASQMSLASLNNGKSADKTAVDAFAYGMYGIDLSLCAAADGKYPQLACGYDVYRHSINDVVYNGDGTLTVTSNMVVNPGEDAEQFTAVSTFRVNGASPFGYNIISCTVNW